MKKYKYNHILIIKIIQKVKDNGIAVQVIEYLLIKNAFMEIIKL